MKCLLLLVFAGLSFADERVLPFTRVSSDQDLQEVATIVRFIAEPAQVSIDGKSLRVQGSAEQIAAAEFLVRELDQPSGKFEHVLGDDEVIRIFEFTDAKTLQQFQEAATVVRSMGEIRRLFTFNAPRKIVARGTRAQMEQTAWLLSKLPDAAASAPAEMKLATGKEPLLRVYTLPQFGTLPEFQEAATALRATSEIRYAFTYNETRKLALRGTAEQMAMADFILREISTSGDSKAVHRVRGSMDSVRVFEYAAASGPQALQEMATSIRVIIGAPRLFTFNPRRKILLRGAPEDIQLAQWILSQDAAKGAFELGAVREFKLAFATGVQDLQEAATVVRSVGEINRLMAINETKTVIARGSQQQLALADWLFQQLAAPPAETESTVRDFQYGSDSVKVIFLKRADVSVQQLQQTAVRVRNETKIPRMFTYNLWRAIVVRGSADQTAQAAKLLF